MQYSNRQYKQGYIDLVCGFIVVVIFATSSIRCLFFIRNYWAGAFMACLSLGMLVVTIWLHRKEGELIRNLNDKIRERDAR